MVGVSGDMIATHESLQPHTVFYLVHRDQGFCFLHRVQGCPAWYIAPSQLEVEACLQAPVHAGMERTQETTVRPRLEDNEISCTAGVLCDVQ